MKRSLLLFVCLFLMTGNLYAGDKTKPNTLTAKEIQDGWLLLFDGETTFGWTIEGDAKVEKGWLILGGEKETTARFVTLFGNAEFKFDHQTVGDGAILNYGQGKKQKISPSNQGHIATSEDLKNVEIHVPAKTRVSLKNVKLRPQKLQSIFNHQDMTGWTEFPNKKSKFTITKEGWLNVKDGPGDLQTKGKWQDFVLQLECISNGKHLNSGIFFRCRANEYQNGYEAQIRNEFTPGKLNTYMLDNFDPFTHKLIGKFEVKSPAVDYGTGAIYRRQPARKQMSRDNEWFTMTVVAHGNHFATWVNGVQVTDWTDHRPLTDNARTGCCLNPGHISIQGHDPTTDLSFRNFRIGALAKEK